MKIPPPNPMHPVAIVFALVLACAEPVHSAATVLLRERVEERLGQRTRVAQAGDSSIVLVVQATRSSARDTVVLRRAAEIAASVATQSWPDASLRQVSVVFERPVRFGPLTIQRRRIRFDLPAGAGIPAPVAQSVPSMLIAPRPVAPADTGAPE